MKYRCGWRIPAMVGSGLLLAALGALPQQYTISARPGAINYVEAGAKLNRQPVPAKGSEPVFLSANDTLATADGKAEVLLTPGVFLRLAGNSEIVMVSPHLTNTVVELTQGAAVLEVAQLLQDNDIQIVTHGATVKIQKPGLYQVAAGDTPMARVYEGKVAVEYNGTRVELGKGRELRLAADTKPAKFDTKTNQDDLYAWSKIRDEYDSASSYDASSRIHNSSLTNSSFAYNSVGGAYGTGMYGPGMFGPGWFWNSGWNSWAWLPGDGAFFSPYGFGYYAPGFVQYAPVVYVPVRGGGGYGPGNRPVYVPVNPSKPSPVAGAAVRPVVPSGAASARQMAPAFSNVRSSGGHVGGNTISATAHPSPSSGGAGGGGGFGGRSGVSAPPASMGGFHGGAPGGAPSSGHASK
jgi:FecR protein